MRAAELIRAITGVVVTILMVSTAVLVIDTEPASALADAPWGSTEHRYRLPIDVTSPPGGTDLVAVAAVDFTAAFADVSVAGAPFDPATLLVHEVNAGGLVIDANVAFQFDPADTYNPTSAATGELVIAMAGSTAAQTPRYFLAYFEEDGVLTTPASVAPVVTVNPNAFDEGAPAAHIATQTADYFYDLAGGGFSSILDTAGLDWVNYHPTGGSGGSYRGIPNLVYPEDWFSPGSTAATTTIDSTGPLRAVMTSTTANGWKIRWEIFGSTARATLVQNTKKWWFLYEGTPGGSLDAGDVVVHANGNVTSALDPFEGDIVGAEWLAFADPGLGRSLFLANHSNHPSVDSYRALNGEMTVFGFGRQGLSRGITGKNRSFSLGFVESAAHASIKDVARPSHRPPQATIGTAEKRPAPTGGIGFISDDFNSASLGPQWTFIDPVGDSSYSLAGVGSGQATATLSVPGGTSHDAFNVNEAARLMQPINDVDFELEAGFVSAPSSRFQINGMLVEQDADNWIRYDLFHTGSQLKAYAGRTINGITRNRFKVTVPDDTKFLRLNRTGDQWTGEYSSDGLSWTVAGTFDRALAPTSAGVLVGNAGNNPAFDGVVDYMFDTAAPIVPEDGGTAPDSYPVNVSVVGDGSVSKSPDQAQYVDGSVVQLTATPDAGGTFVGWTGGITSPNPVVNVGVVGGAVNVTATFTQSSGGGTGFTSDDFDSPTLGSQWSFVDPVGDSSHSVAGAGSGQATATIALPAGTSHDAYNVNEAARLMQPINDVDFELEAGFVSAPSARYQFNGMLVEQDADNWIRYDLVHNGTLLKAYAGRTINGITRNRFNVAVPNDTKFLRLNRTGDQWTGEYSSDGLSWAVAGTFDRALAPTSAGVLVGNAGNNPAFNGVVDYMFDTAAPIVPEDGGTTPASYPVNVSVAGDGSVSKSPDLAQYVDGSVVQLTATPDAGRTFVGWTGDATSSNQNINVTVAGGAVNVTATFTQSSGGGTGFTSDDFDSVSLGSQWTFVDPVGDSSYSLAGAGSGQATATLSIPAGTAHDPFDVNEAARLMQSINDVDFELEAGFVSTPASRYQINGILVEQDVDNWIRMDIFHNGSQTRVYAGRTLNGDTSSRWNVNVPSATRFLRLNRTGDQWTGEYSSDGTTWSFAGTFSHAFSASSAGVLVGNAGNNPAYDGVVDYIFDVAAPIVPEDGNSGPPTYPVNVSVAGNGSVTKTPDQSQYTDGSVVQLSASPSSGATFVGWTGDITSSNPVENVTISGGAVNVTATFSTSSGSGIDVWYGTNQTFGDDGVSQNWINILGNASDPQGISSLGYRLNGGSFQPINVGPDLRRIYGAGDFNVEIDIDDLNNGSNSVLIEMTDGSNNTTSKNVNVTWTPSSPNESYTINWSTASDVQDGAQIVDGNWGIVNGKLRTLETGYDRTIALGDLSWQDYEIEVPVTLNSLGPGGGTPQSGQPLVGMGLRWQGHSVVSGAQPNWGFWPTGAFGWWRLYPTNNNRLDLIGNNNSPTDKQTMELSIGTTYIFKARVDTVSGGDRYRMKIWQQGQSEPGWQTDITETSGPSSGSVLLIAHHYDVSFGNVTVTPV